MDLIVNNKSFFLTLALLNSLNQIMLHWYIICLYAYAYAFPIVMHENEIQLRTFPPIQWSGANKQNHFKK